MYLRYELATAGEILNDIVKSYYADKIHAAVNDAFRIPKNLLLFETMRWPNECMLVQ